MDDNEKNKIGLKIKNSEDCEACFWGNAGIEY